jgi:DNA primase
MYTKESLEKLRERIDLLEVISGHVDMKRMGASFKGLCPFHEEKTPSFILHKGDSHYHCFGCGAHGDAIQFLMNYLRLSFSESVETLAEKFQVPLQRVDRKEEKGIEKALLREALDVACTFFHSYLLHTEEGREAIDYLCGRGLTLDFIQRFEIGLAPKEKGLLRKVMHARHISDEVMLASGLLAKESKKEFFQERITFPIKSATGSIIGFSSRKYHEETYGGKYINTFETALFKKSKVLFGLNYSRERIARERRAIIVEGQIDCLKMIESGFNLTVASLGTAFGEEHVKELQNLSLQTVFILFDGDEAGENASSKTGNLFQKMGIEVKVVVLPKGLDPDSFLRAHGAEKLKEKIQEAVDYLTFQVGFLSQTVDMNTPAGKTEVIRLVSTQIRGWDDPVMVHESLRKLAAITHVPEEVVGLTRAPFVPATPPKAFTRNIAVDLQSILEMDLLRLLLLTGEENQEMVELSKRYLDPSFFHLPLCKKIFTVYMEAYERGSARDLFSLMMELQDENLDEYMSEILNKKINREKAKVHATETIQKMLDLRWLKEKEEIKKAIESASSDDAKLALLKDFNRINTQRPICNALPPSPHTL